MQEQGSAQPATGAGPPVSPPNTVPSASPAPRAGGAARLFLAPVALVLARWRRALSVLALVALLGVAAFVFGRFLWAEYHLRAARRAVERGHNPVAIRHLRVCREVR